MQGRLTLGTPAKAKVRSGSNFRCRGYDYVSFPLRTTLMLQDTTATWFLAVSEAHRTFKQKGMTEEELERDRDLAMILASGYLCQGSGAIKAT